LQLYNYCATGDFTWHGRSGGRGSGTTSTQTRTEIATSEPYSNIGKSEQADRNLIANASVLYKFNIPELGIYEIAFIFTGQNNMDNVGLRIEVLKGTSKLAAVQAPGLVYKNVNVWQVQI